MLVDDSCELVRIVELFISCCSQHFPSFLINKFLNPMVDKWARFYPVVILWNLIFIAIVSEVASTMTLGTVVCYAYTLIFALLVSTKLGIWGTAVISNVISLIIILPLLFLLRLREKQVQKRLFPDQVELEVGKTLSKVYPENQQHNVGNANSEQHEIVNELEHN